MLIGNDHYSRANMTRLDRVAPLIGPEHDPDHISERARQGTPDLRDFFRGWVSATAISRDRRRACNDH